MNSMNRQSQNQRDVILLQMQMVLLKQKAQLEIHPLSQGNQGDHPMVRNLVDNPRIRVLYQIHRRMACQTSQRKHGKRRQRNR